MQAICNGDYKFEPVSSSLRKTEPKARDYRLTYKAEYWAGVSDTARQFVRSCLTIDPTNRPTTNELLEHPWLKAGGEAKSVDLLPNVKSAFNGKKTCTLVFALLSLLRLCSSSSLLGQCMLIWHSPQSGHWHDGCQQIQRQEWDTRPRTGEARSTGTRLQGRSREGGFVADDRSFRAKLIRLGRRRSGSPPDPIDFLYQAQQSDSVADQSMPLFNHVVS